MSGTADVRLQADMRIAKSHVCFASESGHVRRTRLCLLRAKSGHGLLRDSSEYLSFWSGLAMQTLKEEADIKVCNIVHLICHCMTYESGAKDFDAGRWKNIGALDTTTPLAR